MPDLDRTKDGLRQYKEAPEIKLELDEDGQHQLKHYLDRKHVTQKDIEKTELRTDYQIKYLKNSLQLRFPRLMSDIIRILFHKEEEDLACYLIAFYNIYVDDDLL